MRLGFGVGAEVEELGIEGDARLKRRSRGGSKWLGLFNELRQ